MQHVIIGTAGHIDHGKTTLIKALTGRDTDTLKEEKERGISINLGFTYFDLPSGRRAGIIDVPGHERFIKNMLAGVGGIDIVLLVIAADEGVMPQTREHLNILELLDIKKGIVVISKKDMVDEEWLNMIAEDIKKEFSTTFLKDAPVIPVSSVTGEGLDNLTKTIDAMTMDLENRDLITDFRIPIDRVFTVSGFGTVVTGTLISGIVNEGDECEVYTSGIKTRIRGIQVHEKSVKTAYAGQRVAINLAGVKIGEVKRGDVVSRPGAMINSLMIDCRLNYLKDAPRPLKNRDRIRLYHGTSEILGRIVILDKEIVNPGESALIQVRLESPIAARRGDKYVIRSYSPMHTIGGGTILEPNPVKHKYFDKNVIEELLLKEKGDPVDVVEQTIKMNSQLYPLKEDIIKLSGKGIADIDSIIKKLLRERKIIEILLSEGNVYIHNDYLKDIKSRAIKLLNEFHKNNPLKAGISKEEFKAKIFGKSIKQKIFDALIELLKVDTLKTGEDVVWRIDFEVKFDNSQMEIKNKIIKAFNDAKFQPPKPEELMKSFGKEEKAARIVFNALVDMGIIIKINEDIYLTSDNFKEAKESVIHFIGARGEITAAEFRDLIGSSRKYAISILEYFDSIKLTKRIGDKRVMM
ncbi:selenocysteine-specific translation elongation factor [Fonticella tunisiensis]|uniref:Selenocysteine-specific elongation factor n=1 Tax=Fonticella tunisiensis TaxID=1096341 RepID=A0A4R7KRA6_9CLOT|nr:selenocysteine-specific translation elongation factor [Fonticella tunisiensis]TDT61224.1 selenocysteine-specific elongation factor [Fonticella tunisiensis]